MQYISAHKRLLIRHKNVANNGNVEMQDSTTILHVFSATQKIAKLERYDSQIYDEIANIRVAKKYQLDRMISQNPLTFPEISLFSWSAVAYISGWIVRKLWYKISCETCRSALIYNELEFPLKISNLLQISSEYPSYIDALKLIEIKSSGYLIWPSNYFMKNYKLPSG